MLTGGAALVDICITTPWKGMENVCLIAALLARRKSWQTQLALSFGG
jgi:hypothetical protein